MNDLGVIDRFLDTFSQVIDSGFGLLAGDVAFLTTVLIGIDLTLAGLFWAFDGEHDPLGRLVRKVLYVGVFALILNNFHDLADIVFKSFAGLGLQVAGNSIAVSDLLRPGKLAGIGFSAAHPLLVEVGKLVGFPEIFGNALTVFVLLVAWFLVIAAFFILAVQLFITILEFKLTTLAGFMLIPFALWNKSAFLAERVLGNVIASGVKVMMLAVIVGIGSRFFSEFVGALKGAEPDIAAAMSLVLASLALLGLGIFGPGIAAGLVSGAPQLGAGAALGAVGGAAAATLVTGGAALAAGRMAGAGGLAALRAGASMSGAASTAFQMGQATSGATGVAGAAAGIGGVARAAGGAAVQGARNLGSRVADTTRQSAAAGQRAGWAASGGQPTAAMAEGSSISPASSTTPDWARRLRAEQTARMHRHAVVQAVKDGDRPGSAANPSLHQKDD